jgi:putative solute:sodium symporter small subunit
MSDISAEAARRDYWLKARWLTALLLALWILVTFIPAWWAKDLNRYSLFGWPVAFYMGAQGALIVYLAIVWIYARAMDRLDRRYGVDEGEQPAVSAPQAAEGDDA